MEFKIQNTTNDGIVVLYAPNGTGKTNLCDVLGSAVTDDNMYFNAECNNTYITNEDLKF